MRTRLPGDHRRLAARRLSLQLSAGDAAAHRAVRAHLLCAGAVRVAVGELVRILLRAQAGDAGARPAAARAFSGRSESISTHRGFPNSCKSDSVFATSNGEGDHGKRL